VLPLLLQLQVLKPVISLLVIDVMDTLISSRNLPSIPPIHERVLVAVLAAVLEPRELIWRYNQLILTIPHTIQ